MTKITNKKGQAVIFVIVALFIAVAAIFLFVSLGGKSPLGGGGEYEPGQFISQCARKSLLRVTDVMILQGGFVRPEDYASYNRVNASYLCKNINYYEPCIAQYPAFIKILNDEIKENIEGDIELCFDSLKSELEKRNYRYSEGPAVLSIELRPGFAEIVISKNLTIARGNEDSRSFGSFGTSARTKLYDIASVAQEIVRQEAQFCHFSNDGFSLLYRDFDIKRDFMSDSTKIYIIKDKESGKEMHIAIRGCAIPAGY